MANNESQKIIFYHYSFSPYARRVIWYLQLRGIPYAEVRQPPIMPRPDLTAIGVNYRRIPVMAIGKDIYCDTRIILKKLEEFYPDGKLGASNPTEAALEELLEKWHAEASLFARATQVMPSSLPALKDPKFTKDREQFSGRPWSREAIDKNRPEALVYIRNAFEFLEKTLLADGRNWVLNGQRPALADIQAIWVVHWLNTLPGALPKDLISSESYPKVFAWMKRFDQTLAEVKKKAPKANVLKGQQAAQEVLSGSFVDNVANIDPADPQHILKKGSAVEVFPTDGGGSHRDQGTLLGLSATEIVIELENGLRLHTPRVGFRVRSVEQSASKL